MSLNDWLIVSALLTGLVGSVHCVAMCGGIIGALGFGGTQSRRIVKIHVAATNEAPKANILFPLSYHTGRIASYSIAGAIAGFVGAGVVDAAALAHITGVGAVIAGAFMIALGLYLASWWHGLAALERIGTRLWRGIEPYARRLLPPRNYKQAIALGMMWGWLPCGMVYTALVAAFASGDPLRGALVMLAFGLGTLPLLLGLSIGTGVLRRAPGRLRPVVGVLLIALGAYGILGGILGGIRDAVTHAPTLESHHHHLES